MRHPDREIRNRETIIAILERSEVGRIATVNRRGVPVIKPVNFLYWDERIYFHSSKKGEKMRDVRRGGPVSFEVDEPIGYAATHDSACMGNYYYRSILVEGKASLVVEREKKLEVLKRLAEKYQPEGGFAVIPGKVLERTALVEISVERMTGKENLG